MMAMPQQSDITSHDGVKDGEATTAAEDERVEVEMVAVAVTVEQPHKKCSCSSKEKISNPLKALRGRDHKKKTVIEDVPRSPSFEIRVLPSAESQIKCSIFLSDFDVTATSAEVEEENDTCDLSIKTPTKSFEQTTYIDEVLPVTIIDTTNNSFDGGAVDAQYSPTSQLEFDIMATKYDDKYSEMEHSYDAFEIKRKTQAMKDLDVLLDDDDDDESDSSTFSLDEENENSTLPEANESKSGNGWLFSCTMDDIDEFVEELVSPLDNITNFISCERDDSIIIDKIESVCADDIVLDDIILEHQIEIEECAD